MRGRRVDTARLREELDTLQVQNEWSRDAVVAYLGLSPSFVNYLERGKRQPGLLTAHRLAEKLGCTIDELFPEVGQRTG